MVQRKVDTRTIRQRVAIPAPPTNVYAALVNAKKHAAFTAAEASGAARVGARFTAWDGYISGKHLNLGERAAHRAGVGHDAMAQGLLTVPARDPARAERQGHRADDDPFGRPRFASGKPAGWLEAVLLEAAEGVVPRSVSGP
jgi:hypothetical protein